VSAIDGLRGVAIAVVFVGHLARTSIEPSGMQAILLAPVRNPDLGVQIFFVLSGYLITSLLIKEQLHHGSIGLRQFYARRALRILPAFYLFLAGAAVLAATGAIHVGPGDFAAAGLFVWNYSPADAPWLGHLWSLAVEEQFYLLWPFALARLGIERALKVAVVVIAAQPVVRLITYMFTEGIGDFFHTRADSLLIGCCLALISVARPELNLHLRTIVRERRLVIPAVAFLVLSCVLTEIVGGPWTLSIAWPLNAAAVAVILMHITDPGDTRFRRAMEWPVLVALGVISFSMYLWQQLFTIPEVDPALRFVPVALAATLGLATVSYFGVERPFLRLKRRYARSGLERSELEVPL
jgi:peptidoglycan/LPS O-acetylase OafA/YrhL